MNPVVLILIAVVFVVVVFLLMRKRKLVKVEGGLKFKVKGVTFKMVPVEGGTFIMGDPDFPDHISAYKPKPLHSVTLSSYYIGQTQVTQRLWKAVMGYNPSYFNLFGSFTHYSSHSRFYGRNLQRPVEYVSWDECQKFIEKLNEITGKSFRLPTEAEWEFAARGGNKSQGYKLSGSNKIDEVGWYWKNSGKKKCKYDWEEKNKYNFHPHAVAKKKPNELGIYDMSGNVWEWCHDKYEDYSDTPQTNPTGPENYYPGCDIVCRGGSAFSVVVNCFASARHSGTNVDKYRWNGLRLVLQDT